VRPYRSAKIVIVGAGGQLGRALLSCVPEAATVVGLTHAELDITDAAAVLNLAQSQRPDLIICAAAYTAVDRAESQPDLAALINVEGTRNLALAARETGARLLHVSTDFVFDGLASTPYPPDAQTNPRNVYGKTKLAGEQEAREILADRAVIVRTSWLYAADGNNFVRTMMRLMSAKGHVRVVADQVGSPTAAISLARVLWALADRPDLSGVYHWADAGVASWYDFAVAIAEEAAATGLLPAQVRVDPITTGDFPTPARRPAYSVLDSHALLEALSLTPCHWRTHLRAVIREMSDA
jgi:dTDP-4-dehydrorhamnose reductase